MSASDEPEVCPRCYGRGALDLEETHKGVPMTRPCECVLARDVCRNLDRAWRGLSAAPKIDSSPLLQCVNRDVYITASTPTFRCHLRHVGVRQGRNWSFTVSSDADLITAWLASAALAGKEILDPDATSVSMEKLTLVDLVDPPDLLIIRLGVKSARNSAMPEVFLEAISHRTHVGKPTWVVDQPDRRLNPSHLCYSEGVAEFLRDWDHLALDSEMPGLEIDLIGGTRQTQALDGGMTLSGIGNATNEGARRVERTAPPEKKRKKPYREGT